jgi:hypothetical protein
MFSFTYDWIITIVAFFLFYLRVAQLRGRKRKEERQQAMDALRRKKKGKGKLQPTEPDEPKLPTPRYQVYSWPLMGVAIVLVLVGLTIKTSGLLPQFFDFWWIPTTVGVLGMAALLK